MTHFVHFLGQVISKDILLKASDDVTQEKGETFVVIKNLSFYTEHSYLLVFP